MTDEEKNMPDEQPQEQADNQQAEEAVASSQEPIPETGEEAGAEPQGDQPEKVVNEGDASEDDAESAMLAMLEDLPEEGNQAGVDDINFDSAPETKVSNVEFQHLSEPASKNESRNIDMLLDVNLPIAIELGRTKMSISDILALGPGSVVELNKLAGEPVDLLVNQKVVAKGEVVVIDENFGVRITQLMTPEERLKALGENA